MFQLNMGGSNHYPPYSKIFIWICNLQVRKIEREYLAEEWLWVSNFEAGSLRSSLFVFHFQGSQGDGKRGSANALKLFSYLFIFILTFFYILSIYISILCILIFFNCSIIFNHFLVDSLVVSFPFEGKWGRRGRGSANASKLSQRINKFIAHGKHWGRLFNLLVRRLDKYLRYSRHACHCKP